MADVWRQYLYLLADELAENANARNHEECAQARSSWVDFLKLRFLELFSLVFVRPWWPPSTSFSRRKLEDSSSSFGCLISFIWLFQVLKFDQAVETVVSYQLISCLSFDYGPSDKLTPQLQHVSAPGPSWSPLTGLGGSLASMWRNWRGKITRFTLTKTST